MFRSKFYYVYLVMIILLRDVKKKAYQNTVPGWGRREAKVCGVSGNEGHPYSRGCGFLREEKLEASMKWKKMEAGEVEY